MRGKDMVALGRVVLSKRERVIMLQPWDRGLMGPTLRYTYELRDSHDDHKEPQARPLASIIGLGRIGSDCQQSTAIARTSRMARENAPWLGAGQYFVKIFEPAGALASPTNIKAGHGRTEQADKELQEAAANIGSMLRPPSTLHQSESPAGASAVRAGTASGHDADATLDPANQSERGARDIDQSKSKSVSRRLRRSATG
jgi:DNA end-binding protein Ku